MRRAARSALLALLLLAGLSAPAAGPFAETAQESGFPPEGRMVYAVLRHGDEIGTMTVDFERSGDRLAVRSHMELSVSFLSIPLYRFRHDAEERWADGRLVALTSRTNDNGKTRRVRLRRDGDRLRGTYNDDVRDLPGGLLPASLWHPETVDQSALIDPIKGRLREIAVRDRGGEEIAVAGRTVAAHHYSIGGDITREVWYGPDGRLLQVRFPAHGSEITLVLRASSPADDKGDEKATAPLSSGG